MMEFNLDTQSPQDGEQVFTVSQLVRGIRYAVQGAYPGLLWVVGEVSNLTFHSSGNVYFSLKDEDALINCVVFKRMGGFLKGVLNDGAMVMVSGRVDIYPRGGTYQIIVETVKPVGRGALAVAFEELKKKLAEKGYFDVERKRPLDYFINVIGIVTSPTGAALRDMIRIIYQRNPSSHVIIAPAKVQGYGAGESIVRGIEALNSDGRSQVIIVGRGGGSLEDLWAFNEEIVADAIYNSRIPIVSAVGHEVDYTIADFVADVRAPTPSAAAEMVTKRRSEIINIIENLERQIEYRVINRFLTEVKALRNISRSMPFRQPEFMFKDYLLRYDSAVTDVERGMFGIYNDKVGRLISAVDRVGERMTKLYTLEERGLEGVRKRLEGLNPLDVLKRGYAYIEDEQGNNVNTVKKVCIGARLKTRLYDGRFNSIVEGVEEDA